LKRPLKNLFLLSVKPVYKNILLTYNAMMTSRERILTTIRHRQPDRVPVDCGATPSSTISAIAYSRLAKYMGMKDSQTRVYDVIQELAVLEDWALEKFGVDVIDVGRAYNTSQEDWYQITLSDGSLAYYPQWFRPLKQSDGSLIACNDQGMAIARKPLGATFFDQICFPYLYNYPDNYRALDEAMNTW